MIRIEKLVKTFDGFPALNSLNLHVKKGSLYGLVGVNGSGKTTIIRHISGMYRQDNGTVEIDGMPVYDNTAVKSRLGYIADDLYFFGNYSISALKSFYSRLYKSWSGERFNEMSALFKLDCHKPVRKFSKGMQKQAAFILAMSVMPDVLLLDEPIDGLDPLIRRQVMHHIIKEAAEREMTVLLSSHNLKEIEGVCDTVGIVKEGRMVIEKELDDLKAGTLKLQLAYPPDDKKGRERYKDLNILHYEKRENSSIELLIVSGAEDEIMPKVKAHNPLVCEALPLTLDEIFVYETEGAVNEIFDEI
ncbi:MAG: ABC transporter ATP-binding protein [Clostridiales bacterium]|jgi:ABC-2 type transport system ATP-binding protein|nr:ABC transporter ATP-binding protein [Clostridiales bacterium]